MTKIVLIIMGSLMASIILIASSITRGKSAFTQKVQREILEIFKHSKDIKHETVTISDIEGLPEPVQRWMKHSQVIGKEKIASVRLKQKGFFLLKRFTAKSLKPDMLREHLPNP